MLPIVLGPTVQCSSAHNQHRLAPHVERNCNSAFLKVSRPHSKASRASLPTRSQGCKCAATVASEPAAADAPSSSSSSQNLQTFARNASGEWEGVTATFDARGEPQELPENFVPSAFREWEVKVHDWQTLCSTQVTPDAGLQYGLKRMMPTVGCEADAVAFTEEAQQGLSPGCGALPLLEDGSYVLAPMQLNGGQRTLRLESCLAGDAQGQLDARARTRVVHLLRQAAAGQPWQLDAVEVHSERYVAPYNGGAELAGCGGGLPAFATKPKLDAAELRSALEAEKSTALALHLVAGDSGLTEGLQQPAWSRLGEGAILLPKGVATAVHSESGLHVEVAVMQVGSKVRSAGIVYADGSLQAVTLDAATLKA